MCYSEEDAQRIFALVADRQRLGSGDSGGLSLSELEEAARAAGLDPNLVASADAQIDAAPGNDRTLATAPVEVVRQRMIPGQVDDDNWAQMMQAMRAEFGDMGMAGQVDRLREWTRISGGTKNGTATRLSVERVARHSVPLAQPAFATPEAPRLGLDLGAPKADEPASSGRSRTRA